MKNLLHLFYCCIISLSLQPFVQARIGNIYDTLQEGIVYNSSDEMFQAQVSGEFNLETYYTDANKPAGLLFPDDKFFLNARFTLALDAFYGERLYSFIKFNWDRGFDPGYMEDGQSRFDEYLIRFTVIPETLDVQAGKFATVFGSWVARHEAWENPFINAPLPYENITVALDSSVKPGPAALLGDKKKPDVKKNWIPVVWGPAYTKGIALFSNLGPFSLAIDLKNAALSSRPLYWDRNYTSNLTWSGRIGLQPNAAWTIGASASYGPYLARQTSSLLPANKSIGDFNQTTFGLDLAYAKGALQLWSEFIYSEFQIPNVDTAGTFSYYIEGKYKWSPRLYSAIRWNQQFFDPITDGAGGHQPWDNAMARIEFAMGYRVNNNLQLKAQYGFSDQNGSLEQGRQSAILQCILRF